MTDLLTPCCGVVPGVEMEWYGSEAFPNGFYCTAVTCYNDWDKDGKAASYNK